MTATPAVATGSRTSTEHVFYGAMSVAVLAAVCFGFARSFLLRGLFPSHPVPPEPFFLLHGMVYLAWYVLLVVQSMLVARRRVALHRSLGVLGGVLATVMVVLGLTGAIIAARRPGGFTGIPVPPLQFMAIPFFDMLVFPALIGAAFALRRDLQAHKRLMLIGSIGISTAAIARWPVGLLALGPPAFFGVTDLFLVPVVVHDLRTRRSVHPATLWGCLVVVLSQPLRLIVSGTGAWISFASWLTHIAG